MAIAGVRVRRVVVKVHVPHTQTLLAYRIARTYDTCTTTLRVIKKLGEGGKKLVVYSASLFVCLFFSVFLSMFIFMLFNVIVVVLCLLFYFSMVAFVLCCCFQLFFSVSIYLVFFLLFV